MYENYRLFKIIQQIETEKMLEKEFDEWFFNATPEELKEWDRKRRKFFRWTWFLERVNKLIGGNK